METDSHNSIRCIERLFYAISVMDINVDVQHTLVIPQKLENSQYDVCVAKGKGFSLGWSRDQVPRSARRAEKDKPLM